MDEARLSAGGRLGRYEIVEHLASGGMAELYLCRKSGLGGFQKQVVLKTIRAKYADEDAFTRMFLDEARIAGSLNHPNVVSVLEADEVDGVAFLVMEYVPGPTVNRLVRFAEQLDRTDRIAVTHLLAGAARGLHHVHNATSGTGVKAGLVHRDVSLDNILAHKDGLAKVIDFGIAFARERLAQTEGDVLKGKLSYVAPEQLANQPIDYRADIYSLGVCLYRATVGKPPFEDANPAALLKARLENTFKRPREVDPAFPEALERVILTAMQAEPTRRQASAGQLANELDDWIRSERPKFDEADVAAWIARCFHSEADYRPRSKYRAPPLSPSDPLAITSASASSLARQPASRDLPGWAWWTITIVTGVIVGVTVVGLIHLFTAPPPAAPAPSTDVIVPATPLPAPPPEVVAPPAVPPAVPPKVPPGTPTAPEAKPDEPAAVEPGKRNRGRSRGEKDRP